MPETKIGKHRDKGLGGGDKKGVGTSTSVLELQKKIMGSQLNPDVVGQFAAIAAKGGKKSSLFFTTSTYKQIKKLLTVYVSKQGTKPIEWRRQQIGSLDGLLESWFSKDKNSQDKSDIGRAKWAAMQFLQPKVKGELQDLSGSGSEPKTDTAPPPVTDTAPPAQEATPEPQQWQRGGISGGRGSVPMIGGTRGKKTVEPKPLPTGYTGPDEELSESDESEVEELLDEVAEPEVVETKPEPKPLPPGYTATTDEVSEVEESEVEDEQEVVEAKSGPKPLPPGYTATTDEVSEVEESEVEEQQEVVEATSGPKPLPPGYTEVQDEVVDVDDGELSEVEDEQEVVEAKSGPKPLPPGYSEVQDEVVDVDDGELSESEVEEAVEEKVLAKVEEHEGNEVEEVEALAPVGSEKAKAKEKPGYTTAGYTEVEEEQKDDDLSVSSSSAPPVVKEFVAEQKPFEQKRELSGAKYKYVSEVRDVHRGEHEAGSVVLKMIYDELQTYGKQLDSDGKRTGWKKLDEPGVVPFEDDDDRAAFLKSKWQWGRNTFDKYYRRLVQLFGGAPPDPEVETPTSELVEEVHEEEDESEARQSEQRAPVDTKYSDLPGEGSDQDPDSLASDLSESEQEEEEKAKEEAKEPEDAPGAPIKVKAKKTEEDRAKYRLQLGTPMVRGTETKPFDTASMTTNRAGAGWAIFVMTSQGQVYAGSHKVGIFHHSSFLGGGQTAGAGEIKVAGGKLTALTNKSGHYIPGDLENLQVIAELQQAGIAPSSYSFLNYTPDEKKTQYATAEEYLRAVQLKPEKDLEKERARYKR